MSYNEASELNATGGAQQIVVVVGALAWRFLILFVLSLSFFLALVATARKTQLPSPPPVIAPVISSSTRSYRCLAGLTRCLLSLTSRRIASQDSLLAALVGFSRRILSPTAVAGFTRWLLSPDSLACCSRPIRSLAALAGLS